MKVNAGHVRILLSIPCLKSADRMKIMPKIVHMEIVLPNRIGSIDFKSMCVCLGTHMYIADEIHTRTHAIHPRFSLI